MKLVITLDREITINDVQGCTVIQEPIGGIDYKYSTPGESTPEYSYFEILLNGIAKILAVAGKVEMIEIPVTENIIQTWDKKIKS